MPASHLTAEATQNDEAARAYLEAVLWPNGPVCPHCGASDRIYTLSGKTTRPGVRKCGRCRKPFTVTVGTVFERSHVALHKWVQAFYLLCCSKKGISAHQLHRILGVSYKAAWFMGHRIREAMRDGSLAPMGGASGVVEADETYFGTKAGEVRGRRRGPAAKRAVIGLVERGGSVRTFHVARADKASVGKVVTANVTREAALMTDESRLYGEVGTTQARHEMVRHSAGEYVRDDAHTNTIEGYFSIFKRGMRGIYQHCAEKHLHRYLAEFDFRYNARKVTDAERATAALADVVGKRLTYRRTDAIVW